MADIAQAQCDSLPKQWEEGDRMSKTLKSFTALIYIDGIKYHNCCKWSRKFTEFLGTFVIILHLLAFNSNIL